MDYQLCHLKISQGGKKISYNHIHNKAFSILHKREYKEYNEENVKIEAP